MIIGGSGFDNEANQIDQNQLSTWLLLLSTAITDLLETQARLTPTRSALETPTVRRQKRCINEIGRSEK
jgi:hypothetical protein